MRRKFLAVSLRALLVLPALAPFPSAANDQKGPTGRYAVEGQGPEGGAYTGTVEVVQTGDTFRVTWVIAGQRFNGTGIGDSRFMSVSYRSGNDTGLVLLANEGEHWTGIWTYAGGTRLGQERWVRR